MADELVYVIGQGSKTHGFNNDDDGNPFAIAFYAWEEGSWVEVPMDADHMQGINGLKSSTDPPYAVMFIPHTAITFDSDDKITNVKLPE